MAQDGSASRDQTGTRSSPPVLPDFRPPGPGSCCPAAPESLEETATEAAPFEGLEYPQLHLILTDSLWREARWRLIHGHVGNLKLQSF